MEVRIKLTEPGEWFRLPRDIIFKTYDFESGKTLFSLDMKSPNKKWFFLPWYSYGCSPHGWDEYCSRMKKEFADHKYLTFFGPPLRIDEAAFPIATNEWYPYFDTYKDMDKK